MPPRHPRWLSIQARSSPGFFLQNPAAQHNGCSVLGTERCHRTNPALPQAEKQMRHAFYLHDDSVPNMAVSRCLRGKKEIDRVCERGDEAVTQQGSWSRTMQSLHCYPAARFPFPSFTLADCFFLRKQKVGLLCRSTREGGGKNPGVGYLKIQ